MASFMIHLRVAEKLYNDIENITEKDFIIGSLAPDCSDVNLKGEFVSPSENISHFYSKRSINVPDAEKFYEDYLYEKELSKECFSFYMGYYCHLLTDICWNEFIKSIVDEYGNEVAKHPSYIIKAKNNIWESIDLNFIKNEEPFRPYSVLKKNKMYINNYLNVFDKYSFYKKFVKVVNFYESNGKYLDYNLPKSLRNKIDEFVDSTYKRIINRIDHLWADIPNCCMWKNVDLIFKNWAGDREYDICTFSGENYKLEMSNNTFINKKKEEFEFSKKLGELYVHKPLDFGMCNKNTYSFSLYEKYDITYLSDIIDKLNKTEQYRIGLESGKMLKRVHSLNVLTKKNWEEIYNKKIDHILNMFFECEFNIENTDKIINYINSNRGLLSDRPQCLLHGNYHIGNIAIDMKNNKLGISSLNEYLYGDPWLDFIHIVKSVPVSPVFACGQIDGYFNKNVPIEFFKLLSLYIACNQLSEITWSLAYGEQKYEIAVNNAIKIFKWHNYFFSSRPNWYKDNICV